MQVQLIQPLMEAQALHSPEYGSENSLEFIKCRSGEVAVLRYQRTKDAFKLRDELLPHHFPTSDGWSK
jgi:hypothetical protein